MYCIVLSIMMLFSKGECVLCTRFKKLQDCGGYQVPQSLLIQDIFHNLWQRLIKSDLQQTYVSFLKYVYNARAFIYFRLYCNPSKPDVLLEPTLINVSSITNSDIFFLFDDNFLRLYFWIRFYIEKWFLLIKQDVNILDVLLKYKSEK